MQIDVDADGPLLDAALELFGDLGIARTTIGDIARKAGVNRVTVYRRIGSKDELVQAVMSREATRLFQAVHAAAAAQQTFTDRIAHGFASTVTSVRDKPVLQAMFASADPTVLGQLTTGAAGMLEGALAVTTALIAQAESEQLPGLVPVVPHAAEMLVRLAHSILLTPAVDVPLQTYDDLLQFAHRTLLPAITAC
ncbi:TetR/AcrR family transcriptional regulator [Williamsia sp. 1135]|uniref:TetR/AcrR family transcriptional regulator n=1 Tax=Williamsia sp. 1135 TaxID=1889262 RepID=UPI000A0FE213|nr:TetR/AcrR family transcriptional regulator [Williamsia sp. 1135]ORM27726.1 hypothetical protein BFL43_21695 [Williamsia sp. 1135]